MGLFGRSETPEEKEERLLKKKAKEEAKKVKELEKEEKELKKFANKYNLDTLNKKDLQAVKNIATEMYGTGLTKFGMTLSLNAEDSLKVKYLSALMEQNWLIINQLSRLNSNIEKLIPQCEIENNEEELSLVE